MQGWKVINRYSLAGKPTDLTSFDLWPPYVTFIIIIIIIIIVIIIKGIV